MINYTNCSLLILAFSLLARISYSITISSYSKVGVFVLYSAIFLGWFYEEIALISKKPYGGCQTVVDREPQLEYLKKIRYSFQNSKTLKI